jgi:AraC family transcriptional activator of pobA
MNKSKRIKTYDTKRFRESFLSDNQTKHTLFKQKFEDFFCIRIDDIKDYIRLPVPASKEICHTIIFITSGVYKSKIGYNELDTTNKEILVIPAGQIFSFEQIDESVNGFICHFNPNIVIGKFGNKVLLNNFEYLKLWGNPHIKIDNQTYQFIFNLFHRMQTEYSQNGIKSLDLIQAYLIALLTEINNNSILRIDKKYKSANIITDKFRELLCLHIKEKQKVGDYAALMNITSNHLNKSVKSVSGKSPTRWIDETLIVETKYLLYQTNLSISEIAYQAGFSEQSYFCRIFKKYEGITPTEYRKLIEIS